MDNIPTMNTELFTNAPVATFLFLLTLVTSLMAFDERSRLMELFILHPYSLVRKRHYYTLLTSGLVHADVAHLAFNMISFYFFAFHLEATIGHWEFLTLYTAGLAISDIPTVVKNRNNPNYYCLGASGAITAVIFSFIIFYPTSRIGLMFIPLPIPAPLFAMLYIAFSYYAARRQEQTRINHMAHLWGAIAGLFVTLVLYPSAYRYFFEVIRTFF